MDQYPFHENFEVAIARQMFADPALLPKLAAHMKPDRFNMQPVQWLATAAVSYYKRFNQAPTGVIALQEVRQRIDDGQLKNDAVALCADVLERGEDQPATDSNYVIERIFAAERKSALWDALDQGMRLYRSGQLDDILPTLERADRIGHVDVSMGTDFAATIEARTQYRLTGKTPPRWGTGVPALDDVIAGGLSAGELGCILGAPKFGKSMMLDFITLHCMSQGGTVVYASLEMSEQAITDRHDAAISRIPTLTLKDRALEAQVAVTSWLDKCKGGLIVKQFTPQTTTPRSLRTYLSQLRSERSIVPTMLVVDYGDLLGADGGGFDKRYEELGSVYTGLRALAVDFHIPVWTASQANREALSQKIVTSANIAESFKKVAIADVILAICRTEEERLSKLVRFFVSQCRYATDGVEVGPFRSAFDIGRIVADGGEALAA